MPTIYKVRDPVSKTSQFFGSYPQVRKIMLERPDDGLIIEPLEYAYKWQLVVMMNDIYKQGREDVSSGLD